MSRIDPTARIEDGAVIGDDVTIGPYCIIGKDVTLGGGCRLLSHVNIAGHTTIGSGTVIYPFASIGTPPQSLGYRDEPTRLVIGEGCTIRESVTMNIGTAGGRGVTTVGHRCFFMAYSHVGHDCSVGNDVVFANSATLGGHCEIGDFVWIGGLAAIHQHTRVGPQAMVGGVTGVVSDIIPFGVAVGDRAVLEGLNVVGMRRRKFSRERLHAMRNFYQRLFHGQGTFADRLDALKNEASPDPAATEILDFIGAKNHRALCFPRDGSAGLMI
jgi:UDP-N-acetylglucosamine acyltransferase